MPKISVVIPVYNTEEYLEQCVESVLNQTMMDLEVICVDDCSRDSSYEIMKSFAAKDPRVKIYRFDESKSALQARKTGVLGSTGEYILFLDADDYLEQDACEKIYNKIRQEQVDILHFSSRVVNCANLPQSRIDSNQKLLTPYQNKLEGRAVFEGCFRDKKFFFTLWNKLINGDLCRKAFTYMEDKYLPKAQDLYSFFIIAYFAKSYMGWACEPLHNYCLGRGVVGSASMNPDKFERYCTQVNIVSALAKFSADRGELDQNQEILDKYHDQWIEECVRLWKNELPKEFAVEGWNILCRYWGVQNVISCVAKLFWYQRGDVARKLEQLPRISLADKKVKTIAIYYYHFTTGGVQRVMCLLAEMFIKLGYKVVIITDSEETAEDFPLPVGAERISIYTREQMDRDNVKPRLEAWDVLMQKYQFDMVFYHAWTSHVMLWDFLYLKNAGIPVIAHAHSVFSFAVNKFQNLFTEITKILPMADGMVVLSDADKVYWDAYAPNVYSIPNPIAEELQHTGTAQWENKSLIWVGRVSNEKQPWAIFAIMEKVVRQVPDAKIYLLGNFDDPKWQNMVQEKGLQENVIFCGLTQNVKAYYEKASVHLSTSKYEGFQMTILEAQAHSIPTVMFRMPNLTIGTPECGVIGVDMMDYAGAADEIVKLLTKQEHWNVNSALARDSYERLSGYDYENAWRQVLTGEQMPSTVTKSVADMIHTFVNHYEEGCKFLESQKRQALPAIDDPISYKIGRIITFLPRKIRGGIRCCKEHGFGYTLKRALGKIKQKLLK